MMCDFEQLNSNSNLTEAEASDIAKLIYDTDEYIYPDMFGNKDVAVEVIPKLLQNNYDRIFCKENLFVCRICGRIVGIILWYEGVLSWSNCLLKIELNKLFKDDTEAGEEILGSLKRVSDEYVSKYANSDRQSRSSVITILNICINPDFRGMKIASNMLEEFIAQHQNNTFELCVLCDNSSAINLYKKNLFKITGIEDAYPKKPKHKRYVMRRD